MHFQEFEQTFTVLDDVPLGCFALNPNYEIIFWNRQLEHWTGIPREDILATPITSHFPQLATPKYTARLDGIFKGGPPVVFSSQLHHHIIPVPLKDDQLRVQHTTVTPVQIPDSDQCNALFSIQDMTEVTQRINDYTTMRDQALAEVKERQNAENRLRALFAAMPEMILVADRSGTITQVVNPGEFAKLLRIERLVGRTVEDVVQPEMVQPIKDGIEAALSTGTTSDYEYTGVLRHSDYWLRASFSRINAESVICVVRDITKDKLAQHHTIQLAIEREKASLMGDFIRAASHDFRTSLSVMNTNLYLLSHTNDSEKRAERRDRLKGQVKHLEGLVDSLLTIYRWDTTPHSLSHSRFMVQNMLKNLEVALFDTVAASNITMQFVPTDIQLPIYADEVELNHALRVIVENALHFTEEGQITISAQMDGNTVRLIVEDTGIGIDAKEHENIFKLFYKADKARTHQIGGLGLGLSIAERIVKAHQGRIEVKSVPGQGSTFTIVLPGALTPQDRDK